MKEAAMDDLQIIKSPKGEEMIVLSRKEYERLTSMAHDEDAHDAALAAAQLKKLKLGRTDLVPEAVVKAIAVEGIRPLRAWREYLGLTSKQLAKKTKLARTTISQMETGKRKGTIAAYKAIAKTLDIGIESLIE
jgi:DNA-binding XRE family transcriptional regulator